MALEFDWRDTADKAARNFRDHGISFDLAATVFNDPFAVERMDDREDYGEERFVMTGMAEGNILLLVVYTERRCRNMYNLVSRNGKIVDGSGAPAFSGDVAITNGTIATVGLFNGWRGIAIRW